MESGSSSNTWLRVGAVAAAGAVTAGVGYVVYQYVVKPVLTESEQPEGPSMQQLLTGGAAAGSAGTAGAGPVRKTPTAAKPKGGPSLPARKSPGPGAKAGSRGGTSSPTPGSGSSVKIVEVTSSGPDSPAAATDAARGTPAASLKACAMCVKPLSSGLPARCSGCKAAYYCSAACQKKHWPEHKTLCKASSAGASNGGAPAPETPAKATAAPATTVSSAAEAREPANGAPAAGLQGALVEVLRQVRGVMQCSPSPHDSTHPDVAIQRADAAQAGRAGSASACLGYR
jgi:hypothetical protein